MKVSRTVFATLAALALTATVAAAQGTTGAAKDSTKKHSKKAASGMTAKPAATKDTSAMKAKSGKKHMAKKGMAKDTTKK